ncbi:LolA-related protein [Undibacterium sp.]|jgi:outer membrane lipoprotein-sorting protein|uniref:LolA-related protein n=1 Tax=Undibacterium sp. TaxID=1914977 RepID=UPI002B6ABA93|nr:LolA-related protein [Undibacterium sp.]HTD06378.1 LolA-related protein [Undibacterium sp.]
MNKIYPFSLLLALLILVQPGLARAESWDLPQLMASLAQVQSNEARFTEKKTMALLKAPVESSGILSYRRPDHVEKHILRPKEESLVIDGDEVSWKDGASGKKHSLRLQNNPALTALVESLRATLAGDLPALRRYFAVKLQGTQARWTLTLTPAEDTIRRSLKTMSIEGSGTQVSVIDIVEVGGDRSVMVLQHD